MQIHSVDNTNFQALKISPKLRAALIKSTDRYIESFDNYGKEMADVKLYNVVFDENMRTPKIFHCSKNAARDYFAELKHEETNLGKHYERPAGVDGETVGGFYPDIPHVFRELFGEKAKERYGAFKKQDTLTQASEYSRLLEELEVKQMITDAKAKSEQTAKELAQKSEQARREMAVDNLIEKYKFEQPISEEKPVKKSLWKKIFG